jgi:hypothetical protein
MLPARLLDPAERFKHVQVRARCMLCGVGLAQCVPTVSGRRRADRPAHARPCAGVLV